MDSVERYNFLIHQSLFHPSLLMIETLKYNSYLDKKSQVVS